MFRIRFRVGVRVQVIGLGLWLSFIYLFSLSTINIIFIFGRLHMQMVGFYRSKYKDANGNMKYMATTKFEPVS